MLLSPRKILLCKKKENTCQHPSYIFKTSLKVLIRRKIRIIVFFFSIFIIIIIQQNDEIGPLRDKEDRRFEVVNKSEVWCFVAALQADK